MYTQKPNRKDLKHAIKENYQATLEKQKEEEREKENTLNSMCQAKD